MTNCERKKQDTTLPKTPSGAWNSSFSGFLHRWPVTGSKFINALYIVYVYSIQYTVYSIQCIVYMYIADMMYSFKERKKTSQISESATIANDIGTVERKLRFIAQKSASIVNAWLPLASSHNSIAKNILRKL